MDLQPETFEQILVRLKEEHRQGRLKTRAENILLFAEITKAGMSREEFLAVRRILGKVARHDRAIRRALRQGDEQISKMRGALNSNPATTLEELGNQIDKARLTHQETAFLEETKEDLEAETLRLKKEFEALAEPINKYCALMVAWNDFSKWVASP